MLNDNARDSIDIKAFSSLFHLSASGNAEDILFALNLRGGNGLALINRLAPLIDMYNDSDINPQEKGKKTSDKNVINDLFDETNDSGAVVRMLTQLGNITNEEEVENIGNKEYQSNENNKKKEITFTDEELFGNLTLCDCKNNECIARELILNKTQKQLIYEKNKNISLNDKIINVRTSYGHLVKRHLLLTKAHDKKKSHINLRIKHQEALKDRENKLINKNNLLVDNIKNLKKDINQYVEKYHQYFKHLYDEDNYKTEIIFQSKSKRNKYHHHPPSNSLHHSSLPQHQSHRRHYLSL